MDSLDITQNIVSDLTDSLVGQGLAVTVHEIPRYQEANGIGADLAIWMQNPDGQLAGIHLQAKRQYPNDTYRDLDHVNSKGAQYDHLVAGAARSGARAAYAFYNGLKENQPNLTSCMSSILEPDKHGINVARAKSMFQHNHINHVVRRADVEELCAPLSCLMRCGLKMDPGIGPADALASWGIFEEDGIPLVTPTSAPHYLQPLLAQIRRGTEPPNEIVCDEDIARQLRDGPDEGGRFFTVILASQEGLRG